MIQTPSGVQPSLTWTDRRLSSVTSFLFQRRRRHGTLAGFNDVVFKSHQVSEGPKFSIRARLQREPLLSEALGPFYYCNLLSGTTNLRVVLSPNRLRPLGKQNTGLFTETSTGFFAV